MQMCLLLSGRHTSVHKPEGAQNKETKSSLFTLTTVAKYFPMIRKLNVGERQRELINKLINQ